MRWLVLVPSCMLVCPTTPSTPSAHLAGPFAHLAGPSVTHTTVCVPCRALWMPHTAIFRHTLPSSNSASRCPSMPSRRTAHPSPCHSRSHHPAHPINFALPTRHLAPLPPSLACSALSRQHGPAMPSPVPSPPSRAAAALTHLHAADPQPHHARARLHHGPARPPRPLSCLHCLRAPLARRLRTCTPARRLSAAAPRPHAPASPSRPRACTPRPLSLPHCPRVPLAPPPLAPTSTSRAPQQRRLASATLLPALTTPSRTAAVLLRAPWRPYPPDSLRSQAEKKGTTEESRGGTAQRGCDRYVCFPPSLVAALRVRRFAHALPLAPVRAVSRTHPHLPPACLRHARAPLLAPHIPSPRAISRPLAPCHAHTPRILPTRAVSRPTSHLNAPSPARASPSPACVSPSRPCVPSPACSRHVTPVRAGAKQRRNLAALHAHALSRTPSHGAEHVPRTLRAQVTARLRPSWAALSLPCTTSRRLTLSSRPHIASRVRALSPPRTPRNHPVRRCCAPRTSATATAHDVLHASSAFATPRNRPICCRCALRTLATAHDARLTPSQRVKAPPCNHHARRRCALPAIATADDARCTPSRRFERCRAAP
ncbi:hypothetical protein DENSPDRAFT_886245 [Dentipellis sp. KUC8613]|nr:hypothetical protein DENSPDRAFT_886245 [Dentipellis sp. KUC8613]